MATKKRKPITKANINKVMKLVKKNESIPAHTVEDLKAIARVAKRYLKLIEQRIPYKKCDPDLAGGICETFYADDTELVACFRTNPRTFEKWLAYYPDFKKQILAGRRRFARQDGSDVCRLRWFRLRYAVIARNICKEFKPTKSQLTRCFDIKIESGTWEELIRWAKEYYYKPAWLRMKEIQLRLFNQTVDSICSEFNPDSQQLARFLGWSVEKSQKYLTARKLEQEKSKQYMEGFERSLSGSPKADKGADHEEGTGKHE